jgi:outer membrane protein
MKKLIALCLLLTAATVHGQMTIAYVNSQKLLDTLPSYKKAKSDLIKGQDSAYNELRECEKQLNEAYTNFEEKKDGYSPINMKIEQDKIIRLQQASQEIESFWQQRLQKREQEYLQPILNNLQLAIDAIASRKKINYVLDTSKLLYSKGGIDITDEVEVELLRLDAEAMKK